MSTIVVGLNHRSAPLDVLEGLTIGPDALPKALHEMVSGDSINEAVIVSTCNRTEVYVHAERFHDAYREVRDALSVVSGVDADRFVPYLYVHYGSEAVQHLFRVASGLDSAILGEHEILGQIRSSWETARSEAVAGSLLEPVLRHAIGTGRKVRTETGIGRRTASLSHAAVSLASDRIGDLSGKHVLLVGAGEVGTGIARVLRNTASVELTVCNRTEDTAVALATELGGTARPMTELADALEVADLVVAATGAPGVVINPSHLPEPASVMATRNGRRLLILDLAVPRDVDPQLISVDWIDLLVLGDLQAFANKGIEERQQSAAAAMSVVDAELDRYRTALSAREIEPLLGSMFRSAEALRRTEIDRLRRHHGELSDTDWDSVEAITQAIVTRILHDPSTRMRGAAGTHRGDRLAEALRELFDLS